MKRLLIKRTIYETFEVSDAAANLAMEAEISVPLEDFYLEMFERHNGSPYGDDLFQDTGMTDVGYEVVEVDDED